ncbi:hypothetical protein AMATHDRAFT_137089, partial [Amanita thiersii Skay4041]
MRVHIRKASIVFIGMSGAVGKTTLATIAARALNWDILDTDTIFERQRQTSVADFVASHGWDAFRRIESDILADLLSCHRTSKLITCPAGVVELERNRLLLRKFREFGLVIHVVRERDYV